VIFEHIGEDMSAYQVCEADAVFAVCYQGRPIKIRTQANIEVAYPGPKYAKSSYPSPGHAFNLAERLNEKFNTKDFSVVMMTVGRTLTEG
jgi:hypothetical protein